MSFVVSSGQLQVTGAGVMPGYASVPLPAAPWEYAEIWRTQPQVRTVVMFLARNIAQLGLHVFKRVSDTDRQRLTDHPLAALIDSPMPRMTTFRWVERMVADVALYDNAFGIKLKVDGILRILPVPPTLIRPAKGNWIQPEYFETAGGREFGLDEVVHIHGYAPEALTHGVSAMESLRSLLLEEREASKQRSQMWKSGARMTGVLSRPAEAEEWSPTARARFSEMWRTFAQGGGAEGGTPILEDGMAYTPISISPQQAQYIEARRLTREEVAAAFFIPPPLIGILDNATYSNITEQHKMLYQDTLGPWLTMLQQEIKAQILPDLPGDNAGIYCEFNIQEKMRGSFEEQAAAASTATGGPWMTRNEQRARFNLPQVDDGDELIVPMNVTVGGLASPKDTGGFGGFPKAQGLALVKSSRPSRLGTAASERDALITSLTSWTDRQIKRLLMSSGAEADVGLPDGLPDLVGLWAAGSVDRLAQLQALLAHHGFRLAQVGAWDVLADWNPEAADWSPDVMLAWILAAATTHAQQHEESGRRAVAQVQAFPGDDWRQTLTASTAVWAAAAVVRAKTASTELRSFGGHDAASASGLMKKVWRTGGKNPRASHKAQDGEVVSLDDVFSNGLRWPGDGAGKTAELVNCNCKLDYTRGDD